MREELRNLIYITGRATRKRVTGRPFLARRKTPFLARHPRGSATKSPPGKKRGGFLAWRACQEVAYAVKLGFHGGIERVVFGS